MFCSRKRHVESPKEREWGESKGAGKQGSGWGERRENLPSCSPLETLEKMKEPKGLI